MTKIKICGLSRLQDIETVNEYMPDYIGLVFVGGSRRQISDETAKNLKAKLDPHIQAVGVFVNEEPERIIRLCVENVIDIIQLHGDEDEEYMKKLRRYVQNPIIKAFRVQNNEDILRAGDLSSDYLLLDAYHEKEYGGKGITFDWDVISDVNKPYFLAGGIHSDNVLQAIRQCQPYCIDVSSGVETDGVKDSGKIREFIEKVRNFMR